MIPLTLFLLACGAIYLGTIQAAFNSLMRVSLRLLAEGTTGRRNRIDTVLVQRVDANSAGNGGAAGDQSDVMQERQPADA